VLDWVNGPVLHAPTALYGQSVLGNTLPLVLLGDTLGAILGRATLQWLLVAAVFPLATWSVGRLVDSSLPARLSARVFYAVNPFVFERLGAGRPTACSAMPCCRLSWRSFSRPSSRWVGAAGVRRCGGRRSSRSPCRALRVDRWGRARRPGRLAPPGGDDPLGVRSRCGHRGALRVRHRSCGRPRDPRSSSPWWLSPTPCASASASSRSRSGPGQGAARGPTARRSGPRRSWRAWRSSTLPPS